MRVGISYTGLSLSIWKNANDVLFFCPCFRVPDVTPVIVDFAPLSGTCASAQTLSCSADTGTVDPQDATITIIRESDGMDLASDSRFSPSRTNTPPRTVMLEYAFTGLLVDNSLYTCIVNTSVGSIARDTSVMICKRRLLFFDLLWQSGKTIEVLSCYKDCKTLFTLLNYT